MVLFPDEKVLCVRFSGLANETLKLVSKLNCVHIATEIRDLMKTIRAILAGSYKPNLAQTTLLVLLF